MPQTQLTKFDQICQQVVMFGGLAMRRADIMTLMRSEGHSERCISYFAFHQHEPTVVPEGAEPISVETARLYFDGTPEQRREVVKNAVYA